jgi:hypothetical protein
VVIGAYFGTLSLALLYILAMFGWGSLFMMAFPAASRPFWNDFAMRIVSGCGILYVGFIALSVPGFLHPAGIGIFLTAGVLTSCGFIYTFAGSADIAGGWRAQAMPDRVLTVTIGVLVALQVVLALTPLIFYDLQVYHLLAPAQFLKAGSLTHIPWNVQTNSPLALQLTLGMSLVLDGSGQLAKLLYAIFGCLFCAGVFELIRPAGRRPALLATLFVLCYPEFWIMQTLGVVDMAIAGFIIFGAIWLRQAVKNQSWEPAILSGIAFGLANGSRYQSAVLTAVFAVAILTEAPRLWRSSSWRRRTIAQLAVVAGLALLFVAPWIIRNGVDTGNPVYPLLQATLGGSEWSAVQASQVRAETLGPPLAAFSTMQKFISPVRLLFASPSNGWFGAVLLCGALAALVSRRRELMMSASLGLAGLLVWGLIRPAAGVALLRYNAAAIVFIVAATGAVLGSGSLSAMRGPAIAVVLAGVSFIVAMFHLQNLIPAAQVLVNPEIWEAIRENNVPAWSAFSFANEHLDPAHNKILVIGETRGFWLQIPYVAPSAFNGPQLDALFGGNSNPEVWRQSLARMGITHLLISYPEFQRLHEKYRYLDLPPAQMAAFSRWIQSLPRMFEDGRGTGIYQLK